MVETKEKLNVPLNAPHPSSGANTGRATTAKSTTTNSPTNLSAQVSPFVYWSQTAKQITLKVDLKEPKKTRVAFMPSSVHFVSHGSGARGYNEYFFDLQFYDLIENDEATFKVYDSKVEIHIPKCQHNWWPRVVATPQKPQWLKIDFDRWCTEDDMLEEQQRARDIREDYAQEYERLQKNEYGYIKESTKKVYLILYNLCQFIGYFYVLSVMGILYYRDGDASMAKTYENVGKAMKVCQLLQYLEVLHPIFGYTSGGPLMPFFQVSARNFVLFIMIELEERMQTKPVVFYVFIIWASIEIIRYPYYLSQLLRKEVGLLTWLRYTAWIPLYPLGIVCEGIIILRNIPYFEETGRLSVEMPNKWNVAFDMVLFLKVYLALLILPGSYMVMTHMAKVRAKKLRNPQRKHND